MIKTEEYMVAFGVTADPPKDNISSPFIYALYNNHFIPSLLSDLQIHYGD
jgi:hypothetical protein